MILFSFSGDDEPKPDEITTLLVVGIFIIKAPPDVVQAPNLRYPCINLMKQALQSDNEMVKEYILILITFFLFNFKNSLLFIYSRFNLNVFRQ